MFELFMDLGASDAQCDFPVVYASGARGVAGREEGALAPDLGPLFEVWVCWCVWGRGKGGRETVGCFGCGQIDRYRGGGDGVGVGAEWGYGGCLFPSPAILNPGHWALDPVPPLLSLQPHTTFPLPSPRPGV